MNAASLNHCVKENKHAYSNTRDNIFKHVVAMGQTSCRDKKILIRLRAEKVKQSVANHVLPSERRFELHFNVKYFSCTCILFTLTSDLDSPLRLPYSEAKLNL